MGTHTELLALKGKYHQFWELQSEGYKDDSKSSDHGPAVATEISGHQPVATAELSGDRQAPTTELNGDKQDGKAAIAEIAKPNAA